MLLMLDNYDSFTWNLVHYLQSLGEHVVVRRNDEITPEGIARLAPERLVISPGPCSPDQAGVSLAAIERFAGQIPILGVCLGHQSIGQVFGARVCRARQVMHGKTSLIHHRQQGLFHQLENPLQVTRYHSLILDQTDLPDELEVTAWSVHPDGEPDEIMAIRHRSLLVAGVQFHPESVMTHQGHDLLQNFLRGNL